MEARMEPDLSPPRVAFLAQNAVFVVDPDGSPRRVESTFAEGVRERTRRMAQGRGWKSQSSGGGLISGAALWGAGAPDPADVAISTRGLGTGRGPGEILYCLGTGAVAGAFAFDFASGEERRLYHSNQFSVDDLVGDPGSGRIACTVRGDDGTSDVALFG
jgi:hypothetical protein